MEDNLAYRVARGIPFRDIKPPLYEKCLDILESKGMTLTTPVQAATIPLFCTNKDVAVEAVTGSGKTLAFVLPVIEILRRINPPLKSHQVGAVIISPTRELAAQIANVSAEFVATLPGLKQMLLVGGTSVAADCSLLSNSGANILIGTPGRLDDILERSSAIDIRTLEVLVLDEADRLLDMGFSAQLSSIMARLPKQRRTGLFSATQTHAVQELALAGMRNPVRVEVQVKYNVDSHGLLSSSPSRNVSSDPSKDTAFSAASRPKIPVGLQIQYMICEVEEKPAQLVNFLVRNSELKIIVFVLTCACVDYWTIVLSRLKTLKHLSIIPLHGKLTQKAREASLSKFLGLSSGVLVCTDVAARGLDIPRVNCILQFDPPQDPKSFVHRAGRTARMDHYGNALVFLTPKEDAYVEYMQLQGVPMNPFEKDDSVIPITEEIRNEALKDRNVLEKGLKAFVSFVRGYKEHHCNYIFNWKEVNLGVLGMAFGLLYLPAMPEIRRRPALALGFISIPNLNLEAIRFKDKGREKQRQENLKIKKNKDLNSSKKQSRNDALQKNNSLKLSKAVKEVDADYAVANYDDSDDLNEDYRMLKKLKRGAITEAEFDAAVGLEQESNDADSGNDDNNNNINGAANCDDAFDHGNDENGCDVINDNNDDANDATVPIGADISTAESQHLSKRAQTGVEHPHHILHNRASSNGVYRISSPSFLRKSNKNKKKKNGKKFARSGRTKSGSRYGNSG